VTAFWWSWPGSRKGCPTR